MKRHIISVAVFVLLIVCSTSLVGAEAKIPVIYCTDLFHPHDDPDDHFDIACMYAIHEFDIKAIILDQGKKQEERPGAVPIAQLNSMTGRNIPYAIGLADKLENPEDKGDQQSAVYQKGVETILSILRESPAPVTIIAVGSLRDVAAAYNREPELVRKKMHRLYAFIGEAQAKFQEYNVGLDVNAYRCIMNAGLPVYWAPCFDGGMWANEGNASFWQAKHEALLVDAADPLLNFFIYMILHKNESNPVKALYQPVVQVEKEKVLVEMRNLWCCAVFPYMAGRQYVQRDEAYLAVSKAEILPDDKVVEPLSFLPVKVYIDEKGLEKYENTDGLQMVHRFHVNDLDAYAEMMTSVTRELLKELTKQILLK
jgi:hypothetical protein